MERSRIPQVLSAGVAVALVAVGLTAAAAPVAAEPTRDLLDGVVRAKIVEKAAPRDGVRINVADTDLNVMRVQQDQWAFGAGVAMAPKAQDAYPEGWLWVANFRDGGWQVAFEGEAAFPELTAQAPASVVSEQEKKIFAAYRPGTSAANGDYRTGMRLPYATGQSWRLTGGPHSSIRQSIDLAGGDGRVLAARGGTMYVMCSSQRGWLRVAHDRGYSTDYYHLHNNRTDNGASVGAGAFLGNIGVDVSCGGSATGPHVHFSLRQNGADIPIALHDFGKWQIFNGSSAYQGSARHGSTLVNAGGSLYNYGPLGFTQGIVDTNGGTTLNKRSGPGTGHGIVGSVADGATVSIACSTNGTTHTGRYGSTSLWNRLTDGSWVSDAYQWTGLNGPVNGWC